MPKQNILDFKKWIEDTLAVEAQASDTMTNKDQFDGKETTWQKGDDIDGDNDSHSSESDAEADTAVHPFETPGNVASGTANFMRLHKIQKQMRSSAVQDNARANATNVAHSQTAVNQRPMAHAYEQLEDEIDEASTNKDYKHQTRSNRALTHINMKDGKPETPGDHGLLGVAKGLFKTRTIYTGPRAHRDYKAPGRTEASIRKTMPLKKDAHGAAVYTKEALRNPFDEEQIDELSRQTLNSYRTKAKKDRNEKSRLWDGSLRAHKKTKDLDRTLDNRDIGIKQANQRLNKKSIIVKMPYKLAKEGLDIHIKRPGALTRKAKAAGESNSEYEAAHKNDKGLSGKQARFAINAKKWKH